MVEWPPDEAVAVPWDGGRLAAKADERDERAADGETGGDACEAA